VWVVASLKKRLRTNPAARWAWVVAKQLRHVGAERWFIARGRSADDRRQRARLLRAFRRIHRHVHCAHRERELLLIADFLLAGAPPGDVVECGCFMGGSTAKLSLVAAATGRRLVVCDSFEGVPVPAERDRAHVVARGGRVEYVAGNYSGGGLDSVRANVARHGDGQVCTFVPGYFEDTLERTVTALELRPAVVFIDVDYITSGRSCLAALWPALAPGGRFYTHEAGVLDYLYGITDRPWWREALDEAPPLLIGAGFGMGDAADQLGYFEKADSGT
jgi:hypothetical protein